MVVLQVMGASAIISSLASYWCRFMPCSYELSTISSTRDEEMSSGTEEMEAELMQEAQGVQDFRYGIAKILQGLRKFRNHSENFAIPAKFRYAHFFAIIAKITVHNENLNFHLPHIFAMIAKFTMHSEIDPPLFLIQTTSFCIIAILFPM